MRRDQVYSGGEGSGERANRHAIPSEIKNIVKPQKTRHGDILHKNSISAVPPMTPGKKMETMIKEKLEFVKTDIKQPNTKMMANSLPPNFERAPVNETIMSKKSSMVSGITPIRASFYESAKFEEEANERKSISAIKGKSSI